MILMKKTKVGLFAVGIALANQGWSEETNSIEQGDIKERMRSIEEIIVTATRRAESAQTVPVSVNAFSAEMLEDRTVRQLGDLTRIAPGIRFVHQGGGGNMNVVLRGLSRIPIGSAPNAVISYFADIPLGFQGSNIPTYDLSSVQVLKGPQGTLFGRNAMGGAVVITPQAPTHDFGGYVKGSLGNEDYKDFEGAINIPIIEDKVVLRVAAKVSRRDGYTKNVGVGGDHDNIHKDSYRVSLLIEPTDTFTNSVVFDYLETDEAGTGSILSEVLDSGLVRLQVPFPPIPGVLISPFAAAWDCHTFDPFTNPVPCTGFQPGRDIDDALAQQKAWGPYKTNSEFEQRLYTELWGISNRTEWELGSITLRNIFGYRSTSIETDLNTDGVDFAPELITASNRFNNEQYSDELHLFGKAVDDKLDYLIGAFYIKEEPNGRNAQIFPVASPVAPWVHSYTEKTNKAVFAQVGYDLSDLVEGVKFNAGYRYNKTDQEVCAISIGATNIFIDSQPTVSESACSSTTGSSIIKSSESANTWNIGLDWQINEDVFAYITHRKGYREGGVNAPGFSTPASMVLAPYQSYEPETLKDIEIGLKTDFAINDVPVRFNISVFEGKYTNVVTSFNTSRLIPSTDAGAPQSSALGINTGKRTLSGFESELVVELFDGVTISNSTAYTHQKIDEKSVPPIAGLQPPSLDPASPEWSTTTAVHWVLPVQPLDGELIFNMDYYWQDDYFVGNGNLPSYELMNLRLDWNDIGQSGVDVGFFMRNVLDDDSPYASSASSASLGFFTFSYQEPRMYGLEVKYSFGN